MVNLPSFELVMHGLVRVIVRLVLRKFTQVLVDLLDQLVFPLQWVYLGRLEDALVALVHEGVCVRLVGVCGRRRSPVAPGELSTLER